MISPHDFKGPVVIEIQRRARRDDSNECTWYEIELGMPGNEHKLTIQRVLRDNAAQFQKDGLARDMANTVVDRLMPIFQQLINETAR